MATADNRTLSGVYIDVMYETKYDSPSVKIDNRIMLVGNDCDILGE